MSIREDLIWAKGAADDAASNARDAANTADGIAEEIDKMLDKMDAAEDFNITAIFCLPLNAIGEKLEDAKGRVVATFSSSEQARCVAAMVNQGGE